MHKTIQRHQCLIARPDPGFSASIMLNTGEDCLVPMRRMGTPLGLRCRPLQTTDINDSTWMRRIQNAFPCGAWEREKSCVMPPDIQRNKTVSYSKIILSTFFLSPFFQNSHYGLPARPSTLGRNI